MRTFWQDMRFGARVLFKNPGFTAVAVIVIALGVGANTAIFSVINAVLLRPLPYAEPERLVAVYETDGQEVNGKDSASYPNFFDWRERNQSFENVAVYRGAAFSMTGDGAPVQLTGQVVSAETFDLLRVRPHLGRVFTRDDERVGGSTSSRAAVISHALWQRQFGGDPAVVGRTVTLERKPFEIIGVMPEGFQFPIQAAPVEVWVTSAFDSEAELGKKAFTERRGFRFLQSVARLRPGVTVEQAQSEMEGIALALAEEHPDNNAGHSVLLVPFHNDMVAGYRTALVVLFGAVGCVLLIACANVANLLLARTTSRYKEIAVRSALGASRLRLVRQLITESLLLSLAGGLLGLLLAWWGVEVLLTLIPEDLPRLSEIAVDRWVLGFTFLLSLVTGVGFGVIPAIQGSKTDLNEAMKEGSRGSAGGHRARLRSALVVAEVAIALVLLVGAGLLGQSFLKLQRVDLGFDSHNLLTATVALPTGQYPEPGQKVAFYERLVERLKTLPGVNSASGVLPLPMSGNDARGSFRIADRQAPQGEEPETAFRWTSFDYFETMKIPLVTGRVFAATDTLNSTPVVVVSEAFAKKHFPGEEALGKRLWLPFSAGNRNTTKVEIVGIVGDARHRAPLNDDPGPELYVPYAQLPFLNQMSVVLRTDGDPRSLAKTVQNEVWALDKDLPLSEVKTMDQYLGNAVAQPRLSALLFGVFAGVALALAAVGLYGVMAYAVTQRTHEIGIRLALGAQTTDVLRMIVRQGMKLALLGVVLGLSAAYALTRLMASLLYGVTATDTFTFAAVATILTGVALVACFVPARRATRVEPVEALRCE